MSWVTIFLKSRNGKQRNPSKFRTPENRWRHCAWWSLIRMEFRNLLPAGSSKLKSGQKLHLVCVYDVAAKYRQRLSTSNRLYSHRFRARAWQWTNILHTPHAPTQFALGMCNLPSARITTECGFYRLNSTLINSFRTLAWCFIHQLFTFTEQWFFELSSRHLRSVCSCPKLIPMRRRCARVEANRRSSAVTLASVIPVVHQG